MGTIKALLRDESAATAIEYGLLIALIAVTMIVGLQAFANSMFNMYVYVDNATTTAIANSK